MSKNRKGVNPSIKGESSPPRPSLGSRPIPDQPKL